MPSRTPQVLNEAGVLIRKRLEEVEEERGRLERALIELGGKGRKRRPGRPAGPSKKGAAGRQPKRRRKGGRADQAFELISAEPGISANAVAKKMKIKPNYLYRVLGDMEKEGRIKKDGRQYFPAGRKPNKRAKS